MASPAAAPSDGISSGRVTVLTTRTDPAPSDSATCR
ncbi:Uncharacterised protein [Mycobacteroides abscessus subsp. abscessus]|nr:Uncharacterised protein [Mycobacteroides abscessus subsp. abscessus]